MGTKQLDMKCKLLFDFKWIVIIMGFLKISFKEYRFYTISTLACYQPIYIHESIFVLCRHNIYKSLSEKGDIGRQLFEKSPGRPSYV